MKNFSVEPDEQITSDNGIKVDKHSFPHPCPATEMHIHNSIEILYLIRGNLEITTAGSNFILNPNELVLFRKYTIHAINVISDNGAEYCTIKFHMSILNDFASVENINYYHSFFSIEEKEDNLLWRCDELENGNIIPAINEVLKTYGEEGLFSFFRLKLNVGNLILSLMLDCYNRSPEYFKSLRFNSQMAVNIRKSIKFINANYNNPITARDAARAAGLSYNYFSNCFSRVTGKTFTQYLNKVRINYAKYQLLISGSSISLVGERAGFENMSYFTQEFRRQTGMTPSEFIKKYKRTQLID